ncbi:MAG TPA: hypothetical protein PK395_20700 [bacterium]|nr:hypothetical protein [bacterium]
MRLTRTVLKMVKEIAPDFVASDRLIYVNTGDLENPYGIPDTDCPLATSKEAKEKLASGEWVVMNAPRPIAGDYFWKGEFRHGIFYAAGSIEELATDWRDDHAWLVVPMTNMHFLRYMVQKTRDGITSLDTIKEAISHMGIKNLAAFYNLPWKG